MLNIIWDTRGYFFWLLIISLFCWILERLIPWRKKQRAFREQIGQDFFWLVFNGHYAGVLIAYLGTWLIHQVNEFLGFWNLPSPDSIYLLADYPLWLQFVIFLILKDFLEWSIHNLLHHVPQLWEFHKLHHSIREMDWIGNMRFSWMEIVVYKSLSYFPLVILGVDGRIILWIAIFTTLIGHLNHANLNISWGPFRYIFNSPRMHAWHHDIILRGQYGKNFAVVFSLWDWVFGTAYMPFKKNQPLQPKQFGFDDMDQFPRGLLLRMVYPFWKKKQ